MDKKKVTYKDVEKSDNNGNNDSKDSGSGNGESGNQNAGGAQTGDEAPVMPLLLMRLAAMGIIVLIVRRRKIAGLFISAGNDQR